MDRRTKLESEGVPDADEDAGSPYGSLLALAGTATSEFTDVSVNKYDHVAEAYSAKTPRP